MSTKERYRVKPGLSISSKDLYRRYRNNSLQIPTEPGQYSLDVELQEFTRMEKTQQLHSLNLGYGQIQNLEKQIS